ncbi:MULTISPECIES: NAD(P)-binding domain-containing protein [unclassified Mesorhizobium]|uniref:NAD(P)-dependent oxidoreductase n=1 Tax=unclassified Mesorhizobium TaxID=325217 RepID=UPI000FCB1B16|nr:MULTISPECIES: NAD(P)-binding domain-containing protein [unclassified Mesorhizobium]RUU65480.1 NAD(P)-dependent oxidoreductase [Mesorhizobium sp. M7A.T.Ca.TU.009.01.1.1]TJV26023.1 MAG: NAD(P)-dependent oxidoreductase [Mesorhizobium sp.]RUT86508.1 NAD(P)-dependent oxidoreductase [Mesorhizobium sp. M7A.T.Ca.US.000.02.1.1]RUT91704.1 NAD(P)-dependent oxidoreductase [Mesorhizobium sp. M7A.T.Ca.US.000.02.2.1]RUU05398.1 NAD(P)-dependent oxidoreductase [Mesorhizobium sp. M7A.T.Ca.TU.009.02.1.1]
MKLSITVIGTGRMGSALAGSLLQSGYPTTVWNRTRQKTDPLARLGAIVAPSVEEAVNAGEIIIVNVSDYEATKALLHSDAIASAIRGKLIVELTSGTPNGAREAAEWYREHGASYLDGAIMATPDYIGTDAGTILLAGPRAAFDTNRDVFRALGGNVQHVGEEPGRANGLDSALLAIMWGALFGTLHAIAVSQAEEIELGELARQWSATAPVIDGLVTDLIKRTSAGRFASDNETLSSISAHHGAMQHLLELMQFREIDRSIVDGYDAIFKRAIAAGHLHDDFAALSNFLATGK